MSRAPELNVRDDADILKIQQEIEKIKRSAKEFHGLVDENGKSLAVCCMLQFPDGWLR